MEGSFVHMPALHFDRMVAALESKVPSPAPLQEHMPQIHACRHAAKKYRGMGNEEGGMGIGECTNTQR